MTGLSGDSAQDLTDGHSVGYRLLRRRAASRPSMKSMDISQLAVMLAAVVDADDVRFKFDARSAAHDPEAREGFTVPQRHVGQSGSCAWLALVVPVIRRVKAVPVTA